MSDIEPAEVADPSDGSFGDPAIKQSKFDKPYFSNGDRSVIISQPVEVRANVCSTWVLGL